MGKGQVLAVISFFIAGFLTLLAILAYFDSKKTKEKNIFLDSIVFLVLAVFLMLLGIILKLAGSSR